jgi:nucleoside-diphosphate-sugar epimerase
MKILLIGGSGFMGPAVARHLAEHGHQIAVFHRGQSNPVLPDGVRHISGERRSLADSAPEFRLFAPDVVVDFILASETQARVTMDVFRGIAGRVVALSSGDVYRATAIMFGLDTGPPQAVPLTEDSELRLHKPYPPEVLERLRKTVPWLDDEYDKIPVERVILGDAALAGTVLRLPMVFGPGDPYHRLHPYLKRMDDGRRAILIQEDAAGWRGPRGTVENVAAAIALATELPQAAGRIYNVADAESFSELEWIRKIGRMAGWAGDVIALPKGMTPQHLRVPYDSKQDWTMSSARIRAELGYAEQVPLDAALAAAISWERANPPANVDPKQFDYAAKDAVLG